MPTFTADWTEGLVLHASSVITNGSNVQDPIDLDDGGYYRARVQVDLDIPSGSPAGDVTIEIFGSVDGGTNADTEANQKFAVPFTATGNKKQGFSTDGPWKRVKVTNNTGVSVTYVGRWAGLKQVSA